MRRARTPRLPEAIHRLSRQEASWFDLDPQFMEVAVLRFGPRPDGSLPKPDEVISRAEQLIWRAGPDDIVAIGRRRVRRVPGGLARPQWEDDPGFELRRHVCVHPGAGERHPVPLEEQDRLIIDAMCRPLDLAHPPWRIEVIESFADGTFGLLLTMHHAMADGVSAFAAAAALTLDVTPTVPEIGCSGDRWIPDPPHSPTELVLSAARDRAAATAEGARRVVRQVRRADGRSVSAAIARLAGYHHDEPPPPERSTAVAQTWESRRGWNHRRFRIPLLDLRLASRAFGATVTDLLLAATAKSWPAFAPRAQEVWVRLPVNLRAEGSVSATNQVAYVIVGLETTLGLLETLRRAQERFGHVKTSEQALALTHLTSLARRLPAGWQETHLGRFYNPDLILSSMPALPFALYCQGAPLVDFASCSTLFKGPGKVTVTTIDDVVYGSMLDAGGTDPNAFSESFRAAIEELCRLGRVRGLLASQSALAALSTADLDALTTGAEDVSFGRGDVVVREGEIADAFFAILAGTAQVTVAGVPRGQLGAGDSFGEIGIFSGPARAATVTALEPLRATKVSREALLGAFHGDRVSQRPVDEVIESYQRQTDAFGA